MFNLKNLFILCLAAVLAVLITLTIQHYSTLAPLASLLLVSLLTGIFMQILQNLKLNRSPVQTAEQKADNQRESGTVKWFDSNKGYGFITRSMGDDIFVHFRSIRGNGYRSLYEGQLVEFLVTNGDKGPQAEDILVKK